MKTFIYHHDYTNADGSTDDHPMLVVAETFEAAVLLVNTKMRDTLSPEVETRDLEAIDHLQEGLYDLIGWVSVVK